MGGRRPRERCEETELLAVEGLHLRSTFWGGLSKLGWCLLFSAVLWVSGFGWHAVVWAPTCKFMA